MALHGSSLSESVLDRDKKKGKKSKRSKGKAIDATSSAISGATTGAAVGGPIGAIAGAAIGAGSSLIGSNKDKKDAASANRPKRRRLSKAVDEFKSAKGKREAALGALSQAVSDFAANLR